MGVDPYALWEKLNLVSVFGRVDRTSHPSGWGYDLTEFVPLEPAEALPTWGQA
jgi:hypothetical protein